MRVRVRWPFLVVLFGATVWGTIAFRENARRQTEILAITTCPWRGEPVTRISPGLTAMEQAHVDAHEGVHAQQCRSLGPFKYRLRNLTSKLSLEAPAYCAGAMARLEHGMDTVETRGRLIDDAVEALSESADSAKVVDALTEACPILFRRRAPAPRTIRA